MSALDEQVGGTHYKGKKIQPVYLMARLRLNAFQGNLLKYPSRYEEKNGLEDLTKTIHYCQLGKELNPDNYAVFYDKDVRDYCHENNLPDGFYDYIENLVDQNWDKCIEFLLRLIRDNYA